MLNRPSNPANPTTLNRHSPTATGLISPISTVALKLDAVRDISGPFESEQYS